MAAAVTEGEPLSLSSGAAAACAAHVYLYPTVAGAAFLGLIGIDRLQFSTPDLRRRQDHHLEASTDWRYYLSHGEWPTQGSARRSGES